jgi:hypothetical protein
VRVRSGWLLVLTAAVLMTAGGLLFVRPSGRTTAAAIPTVNVGQLPASMSGSYSAGTPRSASARPPATQVPARLVDARLGVDAAIEPVSAPGNVMQIPLDPRRLGWWRAGAAPGDATGSVVIVGHINYAGVSGALSVLPQSRPGDQVVVTASGRSYDYRVAAVRSYPKTSGIPADAFSRSGTARLTLITCGGPFDQSTGNYLDNIVVYATPL